MSDGHKGLSKHPVFQALEMKKLTPETFDAEISGQTDQFVGVFFWGHNCPNCDVAKTMMLEGQDSLKALPIRWYHVNTYEHFELGTRFGLFGIPTFLFFKNEKRLGKITPFPGLSPFLEALTQLTRRA